MTYDATDHIGKFSYGDWGNAFFMPRPVALNFDGEVVYELDKNDFTKKTAPYMSSTDFTTFTQKCTSLKTTLDGKLKKGTYTLPTDIKTYDEYHDCMIITYEKDDAHPWNLICIASKDRFKKEMLDIQESLDAVDVYFRLQSAINDNIVATLRDVNRTNTDTMFANIKANAVNLKIDQYLTDLQTYLNANVLTNQTCTLTACYEYYDFVYIAVKGANIKEDYSPKGNGEQTETPFASITGGASNDLKSAVTNLYNLKHNTWKIKKSTGSLEKATQYYNYPFAHGTIKCVDGVMSGFSSVNWCTIHKHFSPTGNWEMKFKVNFTKLGVAQYLVGSNINAQPISLSLNASNQLVLTAYKNNTNTVLFPITTGTDKLDTTADVGEYWCTLKFDTVEGYSGELLSTTDEEKKITVAYASTDIITPGYEITFGIDCDGKNDYYTAPLNGEIDIKDGYIKYTNEKGAEEYYWQATTKVPDTAYAEVDGRYYRIDSIPANRKWIIENDTDFVNCIETLDKGTDIINNYTKYITLDSDVSNTDFDGNFMIEFPIVWFKYEMQEDGLAHISICNRKDDEKYHCYTHYNVDGEFIDKIYINAFLPWKDTTKKGTTALPQYRSIADQAVSYDTNYDNEHLWLENINNSIHGRCRYAHMDFGMLQYITALLLLMGRSTDSQKVYGYGRSNGWVANTGETKTYSMFYGTDNTNPLKVFGIENLWGECWKRIAGAVYKSADGFKYKMTETIMDGSMVCRFNTDGQGYKKLGALFSGTSGRYATSWVINEDGIYPTTASPTTATTVLPDIMYWADNGFMWWGGSYDSTTGSGIFSWAVNNANTSGGRVTPMFACKPNIVYEADYTELEKIIEECKPYSTWELTRSSSNGTDVYSNEWWNTPANITTFTTAITTAEGYINHARNQEMVNEAVETLKTAKLAFLAQRQPGTRVIPTI